MSVQTIGFAPEEVRTGEPTRAARLKWVIVVDHELPAGRIVNAAACVAAATTPSVHGLLGADGIDADGSAHAGLPWAGCSVLAAETEALQRIRAKAAANPDVFVADMPVTAQQTRVYDDYLGQLTDTGSDEIRYAAVSLVGPRKRIERIVGGLKLLP